MRLFIALPLPETVLEEIDRWRKPLSGLYDNLRWTCSENTHLTLRFLGSREPDSVISEMKKLNPGSSLPAVFTLDRCGSFGSPPSVLWLSGEFSESCYRMASLFSGIPDENGRTEKRRFLPHVTVARSRRGRELPLVEFKNIIQGSSNEIKLISSTLKAEGPVYSDLFSVACNTSPQKLVLLTDTYSSTGE